MENITYEQFVSLCKYWSYTVEDGYKAMCFVVNILGQHYGNYVDYAKEISHDDKHSDVFKRLVEKSRDDAMLLYTLYCQLNNAVFNMLEKHDENK